MPLPPSPSRLLWIASKLRRSCCGGISSLVVLKVEILAEVDAFDTSGRKTALAPVSKHFFADKKQETNHLTSRPRISSPRCLIMAVTMKWEALTSMSCDRAALHLRSNSIPALSTSPSSTTNSSQMPQIYTKTSKMEEKRMSAAVRTPITTKAPMS